VPIRYRLALLSALVTLVLFGVAGVLFARSFRDAQVDSLDQGLRAQADSLARRLRDPDAPLDLGSDDPTAAVATGEVVAQVLSRDGELLDATREAGDAPVVDPATVRRARESTVFAEAPLDHDAEPFRLIVRAVSAAPDSPVIVVGTSLEAADAASARLERGLLIGGAAAVVLAGLGGWVVAAAALRPVDRMRREAADISEHDTDASLRVPSTGDELAALGTTMNDLLARLQAAIARQRAFVADAGHELRTPLSVLRTELELAERPQRSPTELREAIAHASTETERLARLADSLLFLARSDDRPETRRADTDVAELVERAVTAWRAPATSAGVTIDATVEPGARATVDADLLRRAIDNLLDNALRYSPPGSVVTVRTAVAGSMLELAVDDQGPGFPPDFVAHAFERFRRADDARSRVDGGTGLGLAIVESIALVHGGGATIDNRDGGGATVCLRIPRM